MATGIYSIKNSVNGKQYVGSAVNITKRWSYHMWQLNSGRHGNNHLQNAWNCHGSSSFSFSVIEECGRESLKIREQFWLDTLRSCNSELGYNICPTANSSVHSPETIAKMKRYHSEHPLVLSEETKQKIRASRLGKPLSEETKAKLSKRFIGRGKGLPGRKWTEESKQKQRESLRLYYANGGKAPNAGRVLSDEQKAKISASTKGKNLGNTWGCKYGMGGFWLGKKMDKTTGENHWTHRRMNAKECE